MKQSIAVFVVLIVVAGVGFGGYWIGRNDAPVLESKVEHVVPPTVTLTNPAVPDQLPGASVPDAAPVPPKRVQSTYVPKGTSAQPASAAPQSDGQIDKQKIPRKSAAEFIAALEADDHKSAFPNPSIAPHQAMLNETPDPNWSQAAAQQLRDYLAEQLGNRFEYPLVQCGQDICEIQAATLPGSDRHVDVHDFQVADENMSLQPWWTSLEFDELTFQVDSEDDGRDVMIVFVTRK